MPEPMIRLEAVGKPYADTSEPAVDALSLGVPEGEIAVPVGRPGCGKTTALKTINRLIRTQRRGAPHALRYGAAHNAMLRSSRVGADG